MIEDRCTVCGMINSITHCPTCGDDVLGRECPWNLPKRILIFSNYKEMGSKTDWVLCIKYRLLEDSKIVTEDYTFVQLDILLDKVVKISNSVYRIEAILITPRSIT